MRALLIHADMKEADAIARLLSPGSADEQVDLQRVEDTDRASRLLTENDCDLLLVHFPLIGNVEPRLQMISRWSELVPTIVLASSEDRELERRALQAGALDCLPSSMVDSLHLQRSIRFVLERHRLERERASITTRLQEALAAAENAEAHFRVVFESARDGIVVIDQHGRYRDANPAVVEMLGYSWTEICSREIGAFSEEDPDLSRHDFRDLIDESAGPAQIRRERSLRTKDGRVIIVEQHASRVVLPMGPCIVSVWRDVTEQHRASDALRQWAEYFEHSEQGLLVVPPQTDQPGICNPAYARMHGFSVEEIAAQPRLSLIANDERPLMPDRLRRLDESGHIVFESKHIRANGSVFPVLVDATSVRDSNGTVRYRLVHVTDITEQKEIERERDRLLVQASDAEIQFRGIFIAAADAIIVLTRDRRILEANPSAVALLGYERESELLGREIHEIATLPPSALIEATAEIERTGQWQGETEWRRQDSSLIPVEVKARLVRLPDRTLVLLLARDISAQRALEQLRREFLALVAHELRNPLTAIAGWAQLLRRGSDPSRAASGITDQTRQLDRIIGDLLDVSQIESGALELVRTPLDLVQSIESALEQERVVSAQHNFTFMHESSPVMVSADAQRVSQILGNLLSNAVKYSPDGGEISVELIREADVATVKVRDQGMGLAAEALERIFERFARLESGRQVARGSGLGLPISRALAEAHGGRLWAESEGEGQGSTFVLVLPAVT